MDSNHLVPKRIKGEHHPSGSISLGSRLGIRSNLGMGWLMSAAIAGFHNLFIKND